MNMRSVKNNLLLTIVLIPAGIMMIYPFLWMLSATFKPSNEIFALPPKLMIHNFVLTNYALAFTSTSMIQWFFNSLYVTVIRVVLSAMFCSLAGFAFAKYQFRFKKFLFVLMLSTMMVPFQSILIPLYIFMVQIGWTDTYLALWVPWMASAFGTFLMRQYIVSIPNELLYVARIDGAGEFRIYIQIILPLIRPVIGTLSIIIFLQQWRNYLWPLIIINSNNKFTLPLGIANMQSDLALSLINWGTVMVVAVVITIPVLVIFLIMQKQYMSGLTMGAIKE